MTTQRSFKNLVRTRMQKTGESYTAARLVLLRGGADATVPGDDEPTLPTSDATIRERTGRGWEEWFDLLDDWGAADKPRREISRWVASQLSTEPLAWNAQAVTGGYERARLGREVGQFDDGFRASVSKTVAVPVERLYDAFVRPGQRKRWLSDATMRQRTATRPLRARFDWGDDGSRLHVTFESKGDEKSSLTVSHERLADAQARDRMKGYWRERTTALKQEMER
ncbi:MAG TPA: hypothetical protein VJ979_03705 [Actinomycetota bacterium]|nr:hypothetical protein [Actinomycetota bacterium]